MNPKRRRSSRTILIMIIIIVILTNFPTTALQSKPSLKERNITTCNESKDETTSAIYDLLIISPRIFSKHLQPLVFHKNKHNVKTVLIETEEIYNQIFWRGRDKAEKIKYFIKDSIENWGIKYVLLVGGRKDQSAVETYWVPVRYSHLERRYLKENGKIIPESKFLTDLYFADIFDSEGNFSSWDDNNNGIFGEWYLNESAEDIPDLYPDVFVGRLPCRSVLEVKIMVKKIIKYETGKRPDSWFKKMIVVAGDTYPDKTEYYDGEVYTQKGLDMMSDFEPVKLWASDGSLKNWVDVVKAMNKGCGFIWFSGHGNHVSWATHPPNDNSSWIHIMKLWQMLFLFNGEKLPVCISGSGCYNNMFNVSLLSVPVPHIYNLSTPRCWGWALTRKICGGSIATIASTALSYESPDIDSGVGGCELLDLGFFKEYGLNDIHVLGECWGKSASQFLDDHPINWSDNSSTGDALIVKNVEQWLLIGDPSLKIGGYSK